ncbi:hypothetical protein ACTXT7_017419, partial [Hymenolepis weldensis]
MNRRQEVERIQLYLNQPLTREVFRILRKDSTYSRIGIMLNPGGYIELNLPPGQRWQPRWDVVVNGEMPNPCRCMFYLDVANMTQGFMACVFVATLRLKLPMPTE